MARILVIDGDRFIRVTIERALRRESHEVVQAADSEQALRQASQRTFDIALVGLRVGSGGALELLERLREQQPSCLRVLMTQKIADPNVVSALNRGYVTRTMARPCDADQVLLVVNEVMAVRQRMSQIVRVQQQAARKQELQLLRECIRPEYIQLAMQPIFEVADQKVVAYECLLRSRHPVLDGPLSVIRTAQRHNMLGEVGRLVIERSVECFSRIPGDCRLFINIHPDELIEPDELVSRLQPLVPYAHRVVLEISDRIRLEGIDHWQRAVEMITQRGFSIAVDDLGTGYSSLSVLAELRPSYMKVDISIVRGIDTDFRKQRLARLLSRLAEAIDAPLVAEGVETMGEMGTLRACGAHLQQGYLLGRPSLLLPGEQG